MQTPPEQFVGASGLLGDGVVNLIPLQKRVHQALIYTFDTAFQGAYLQ